MSKEIWIAAHEELIEEYLEQHPDATEAEAVEATVDQVDDRYADTIGDMIDRARDQMRDAAIADTHAKRGDVKQAPLVSGAVASEVQRDAQNQSKAAP